MHGMKRERVRCAPLTFRDSATYLVLLFYFRSTHSKFWRRRTHEDRVTSTIPTFNGIVIGQEFEYVFVVAAKRALAREIVGWGEQQAQNKIRWKKNERTVDRQQQTAKTISIVNY